MSAARHPRSPEQEGVSLEDIMARCVGRYKEKTPDWAAFEDAKIEGYKRAQHRFIGAGGSAKHDDLTVIPAGNFTLSIMYVEPGQGNAAHTHELKNVSSSCKGFSTFSSKMKKASNSGPGLVPGNVSRAQPASFTDLKIEALSRCIFKSCWVGGNQNPWATKTRNYSNSAMPI